MGYGRTINATAGSVQLIDVTSIDQDTLNCHFEIHQNTTQSPNTCTFRLYNPSKSKALAVPDGVNTKGTLTISAGYQDDGTVLIFKGDIKQRRIGKENAVTTYVEIIAADGDQAYNTAKVNSGLPKNKTPMDVVQLAQKAMSSLGVTMGYVTPGLLSQPTYKRGQVFFSLARDLMRNVGKTTSSTWSIQNGELQVVGYKDVAPGVVVVNAQTGMLGMPQITPNGIIVRTELNGNVKVNTSIKLNESDIQAGTASQSGYGSYDISTFNLDTVAKSADGTYKVFAVDRVGTLRGDEWYNEIRCVGSSGFTPAQLDTPQFQGNAAPTDGPAGSTASNDVTAQVQAPVVTAFTPAIGAAAAASVPFGTGNGS